MLSDGFSFGFFCWVVLSLVGARVQGVKFRRRGADR